MAKTTSPKPISTSRSSSSSPSSATTRSKQQQNLQQLKPPPPHRALSSPKQSSPLSSRRSSFAQDAGERRVSSSSRASTPLSSSPGSHGSAEVAHEQHIPIVETQQQRKHRGIPRRPSRTLSMSAATPHDLTPDESIRRPGTAPIARPISVATLEQLSDVAGKPRRSSVVFSERTTLLGSTIVGTTATSPSNRSTASLDDDDDTSSESSEASSSASSSSSSTAERRSATRNRDDQKLSVPRRTSPVSLTKRSSRAISVASDAGSAESTVSTATATKVATKVSTRNATNTNSNNITVTSADASKTSSAPLSKGRAATLIAESTRSGGSSRAPSEAGRSSPRPAPPSRSKSAPTSKPGSKASSVVGGSGRRPSASSLLKPNKDRAPSARSRSPTHSIGTINTEDMDLEGMDIDQLERLFLGSQRSTESPSVMSNYSAYVPWKPGVPIDADDTYPESSLALTDCLGGEPDEQLRAGISLIQEAYKRKSVSLTRGFEEERKQRNSSLDEISQVRQRVRELSDSLAKEEEEKKALIVAKNSLMERYNKLWEEHKFCGSKKSTASAAQVGAGVVSVLGKDQSDIKDYLKSLEENERQALLDKFLDACFPHDLHRQQAKINHFVKSRFDLLSELPPEFGTQILTRLSAEDLCSCRVVSKRWREKVREPSLWKQKCLAATRDDPEPLVYPSDPSRWEVMYRNLHYREYNWANGNVQSIRFLKGHTASVTSLKLKRSTLVTGGLDETVRIWDVRAGRCVKSLSAKAVSCIDFVPDARVVSAGFNDQGRVQVWHMDSGELLQTLVGHSRGIRNLSMNQKYLATAGHDMSIIIWTWQDGGKLRTYRGLGQMVLGVQMINDTNFVAVSLDGWVRTFHIDEKGELFKFRVPDPTAQIQWFTATDETLTCATPKTIYRLRWQTHYVSTGRQTDRGEDELKAEPNLSVNPSLARKTGSSSSEIWAGAADRHKERAAFSTRFSARGQTNKSVYVVTSERGARRVGGRWEDQFEQMTGEKMAPMCMDVDQEKVVVGTSGGTVYVLSFVGDRE